MGDYVLIKFVTGFRFGKIEGRRIGGVKITRTQYKIETRWYSSYRLIKVRNPFEV